MPTPDRIFDRLLLTQRRNRVAAVAEAHDFLLAHVTGDLLDRLALVQRSFAQALDLGCHNGLLARQLAEAPNVRGVICYDPAERLLAKASGLRVVGDLEALPFAHASFDLIASALSLHLVDDLPGTLAQASGILKPDGLLLAALLGGETLRELRESWLAAEAELAGGASPRVAPFADVRALGGLLQRAGFALPVVDSDKLTVTYADPLAVMREVKAMGTSNMLAERSRVPVTRRLLFRAAEIYADRFGRPDGRVPATFEIITLTAWAPHASQQKPLQPGSATARLADALGVPERKL